MKIDFLLAFSFLSVELSFLFVALLMLLFPQKSINSLAGYRTERSMQNQQAWDFAQRYSIMLIFKYYLSMLACKILLLCLFNVPVPILVFGIFTGLIPMGLVFWKTEKALYQRFPKEKP